MKRLFVCSGLSVIGIALLLVVLGASSAWAQGYNASSTIMNEFISQTSGWWGVLRGYALKIFGIAVGLDICLFGLRIALQRADPAEIFGQFVMLVLFAAFIGAVIMNYEDWATGVAMKGLEPVASHLTNQKVDVGSPFAIASVMWMKTSEVSTQAQMSDLPKVFLYIGAVYMIIIAMFLLCALMIIAKCEFYILANVGILLIGLGGSKLFKDYGISVMRYILSVALKVFVIQLIANIGLSMMSVQDILTAASSAGGKVFIKWETIFMLLAKAMILICLAKSLPDSVSGLINGAAGGGNPMVGMIGGVGRQTVSLATAGAASALDLMGAVRDSYTVARDSGASGIGGTLAGMGKAAWNAYGDARASNQQRQLETNSGSMVNHLKSQANAARAARKLH